MSVAGVGQTPESCVDNARDSTGASKSSSEELKAADKQSPPVPNSRNRSSAPRTGARSPRALFVTLTISEKAFAELDRIQEEAMAVAQEGRSSWR